MTTSVDTGSGLKTLASKHLQLHMRKINRKMQAAVSEQKKIASALRRHDVTPLCVSNEQVSQLLQQVNSELCFLPEKTSACALSQEECLFEERLRERADKEGLVLPLDAMAHQLKLTEFEKAAVLVCLAPELHRSYGRIFAYIHDDLHCQVPTIGLLCSLLARSEDEWLKQRKTLSTHGSLRRLGLILTQGDVNSEQQLVCRVAPGVLERLCVMDTGSIGDVSRWTDQFYDPYDVHLDQVDLQVFSESGQLKEVSHALKQGDLDLLAVWGESVSGVETAVQAVAANSGKPLRRLPLNVNAFSSALAAASYLGAMVWIDADRLSEDENRQLAGEVLTHLLASSIPIVISGQYPWRPTELLACRSYAEVRLTPPDESLRIKNWLRFIPELPYGKAQDLSHRFRFNPRSLVAVKRSADMQAQLKSNGARRNSVDQLDDVCCFVTQTRAGRFTKSVTPKRGPEDLVLPSELHNQVLEVASFYQTLTKVNEHWGFARLATGAGGIKALFAGDSGTGKTLAAEVIARQIGLQMLKIDLSQLVSKWVGETEKNIDAAFCEAETSSAMLFFDEADTLFGKRGEIQQGSDRYANLEVGYLLQRLEQFPGLVVLASNLKDEIDEGFTRRFHVILHFPRPHEQERLRLWNMAFPSSAPLDSSVDLSGLVHLDMTGAGIFNACHTAALLAAEEGSDVIRHNHIIEGISRQFHRESRVIVPSDLNRFTQQNPFPVE